MWSTLTDIFLGVGLVAQFIKIMTLTERVKVLTSATSTAIGGLEEYSKKLTEAVEECITVINDNAQTLNDVLKTEANDN